jgi:hypothetical protein
MTSVQSEYQRFLTHLGQREISTDARRLANLVAAHLPTLAEVGAARGARSSRLAPIAAEHLATTPTEHQGGAPPRQDAPSIGRLHELRVGPFRGFMRQEIFDLSHDITLVYGANGTGKSSFCEALETAMLGSINEARAKRIDLRIYCNNARLRTHVPPSLTSKQAAGEIAPVIPSEAELRFCFVEKCRLDDFARIAARTPADQRQLIATLFGVDEFTEFVRGFNASLDGALTLVGPRAIELQLRRAHLSHSQQVIATHSHRVDSLLLQNQELAQRIWAGKTFQECIDWLLGTSGQQGRLPWVQAQLNALPPTIHEVTQTKLRERLEHANQIQARVLATEAQLHARKGEISYSKLYSAVLELAEVL